MTRPDWEGLLVRIEEVETFINDMGDADHRPDEAVDGVGETYCLGCEVGTSSTRLRIAIQDYVQSREES